MYNNNGSQPNQGGHLAGYAEVMAKVNAELDAEANARRMNIEGYNEGLDVGQAAGYRNGYNVGHTDGWNESIEVSTPILNEQKDITRQVEAQRDALQADVERQHHIITLYASLVAADKASASKKIEKWKAYSEELKTQRDEARQKLEARVITERTAANETIAKWKAYSEGLKAQRNQVSADHTRLANEHAQQLWLHQRGLVFMNTMYGVLSTLNDDTCPYVEEVRDLFAATWQDEVSQALEAGRMQESPINDPSFVLAYPQMSTLIGDMLHRAGQQYNPVDETEVS